MKIEAHIVDDMNESVSMSSKEHDQTLSKLEGILNRNGYQLTKEPYWEDIDTLKVSIEPRNKKRSCFDIEIDSYKGNIFISATPRVDVVIDKTNYKRYAQLTEEVGKMLTHLEAINWDELGDKSYDEDMED